MRAAALALPEVEVHVWCLSLESPPEGLAAFAALLSPDEKRRADRVVFEEDRDHTIVGRGLLRTLLGGYLGQDPARLEFTYGPQGKPALARDGPGSSLEFNLSHSGGLAIYAFSWGRRLGIDLERVRHLPEADRLASRFFSARENALIRSRSGEPKLVAFFTIWTCKEAILKAEGDGLTKPLSRTEVSLSEGQPVRLISVDGSTGRAAHWRLETFAPAPGYQAALAVEGQDWEFALQTEGEPDET